MTLPKGLQPRTMTDIIKEFTQDYASEEHIDYQAEEMDMTIKQYAKGLAEYEFNTRLQEGSIVKIGRRYQIV